MAFEFFSRGGPIMWPLLLCSIVALAIAIERAFFLRRVQIDGEKLMRRVNACLARDNPAEAKGICEATPGPVAKVLAAALAHPELAKQDIRDSVRAVALAEVPVLERGLPSLGTVVTVSPLLGLLGTISGLMKVFNVIAGGEIGNYQKLSVGIAEALITTFAGLSIAIPFLVVYNSLSSRVDSLVNEMEQRVSELLARRVDGGAIEQKAVRVGAPQGEER
jgi:biopolymer transport protein ExbB